MELLSYLRKDIDALSSKLKRYITCDHVYCTFENNPSRAAKKTTARPAQLIEENGGTSATDNRQLRTGSTKKTPRPARGNKKPKVPFESHRQSLFFCAASLFFSRTAAIFLMLPHQSLFFTRVDL